ncbi:MAG TPA: hypothetical protein VG146_13880 [Verrucomicrobiae bacterium]|nr:hypothetical protein [Verrucomicrobiae bacterium]
MPALVPGICGGNIALWKQRRFGSEPVSDQNMAGGPLADRIGWPAQITRWGTAEERTDSN